MDYITWCPQLFKYDLAWIYSVYYCCASVMSQPPCCHPWPCSVTQSTLGRCLHPGQSTWAHYDWCWPAHALYWRTGLKESVHIVVTRVSRHSIKHSLCRTRYRLSTLWSPGWWSQTAHHWSQPLGWGRPTQVCASCSGRSSAGPSSPDSSRCRRSRSRTQSDAPPAAPLAAPPDTQLIKIVEHALFTLVRGRICI